MTAGQRFARLVTNIVVRAPRLWRVFRRPMTANFDRLAADWDATRVDARRLGAISTALAAVEPDPRTVLDLGTGSGAAARLAAKRWPDAAVTGADVSPGMIAEARRLASSDRESYEVADAARLPYKDSAFDLVTMNNMIPFFDEVARVTAPGGHVDADLGPPRAPPRRARAARLHARSGLLHRARPQLPCPQDGFVLSSDPQGRSRRGSTGPDVSFRAGTLARATGRGSSVGRAHG
jgi:SAM-dependent methyltransferase